MKILAWLLIVGAIVALYRALQRREDGGEQPDEAAVAAERRKWLTGAAAGLLVGIGLLVTVNIASARLHEVSVSAADDWIFYPSEGKFKWDGRTLVGELEPGTDSHAMFPVDWNGNAIEVSWDLTVNRLDVFASRDRASISIGLFDQTATSIDDPDHVGGSGLQACFSDDVRLRSSDQNHLLRTSSSTESGKRSVEAKRFEKQDKVEIQLNETYRCTLVYSARSAKASLTMTDRQGKTVSRELDELERFTSSVAWFGVSTRGFTLFNKVRHGKDPDYKRPKTVFKIENIHYQQS